jgi:hypothetical protein
MPQFRYAGEYQQNAMLYGTPNQLSGVDAIATDEFVVADMDPGRLLVVSCNAAPASAAVCIKFEAADVDPDLADPAGEINGIMVAAGTPYIFCTSAEYPHMLMTVFYGPCGVTVSELY